MLADDSTDGETRCMIMALIAGVTQLAECLLPKQNVVGSNPITRSRDPVHRGSGFVVLRAETMDIAKVTASAPCYTATVAWFQ